MNRLPCQPDENPGSTIDAEIADLLDQYLTDRQRGRAVERDRWLEQHPEHADRLAECLDAAELFGGVESGGFDLPSEPALPASIGDFEIRRELGRGGMGVVYEAREKSLDRIVALKVMRFGIVDPKALDRFRREAETAGALHHTNIVPVYATGREGDTSWYAMQRIEGESLAARLSRSRRNATPPEVEEILDVGIQTADALGHAHERDVVHRDVKPANLILDHQQRVWLTDFGLARRLVDVGATMTGAILGTPRYMSPEQADLQTTDVDHRSDIYSLGATLYEMAAGRPPFEGDDPFQLIKKIRYDEPPGVRANRADLPRDLEVVLQKAMEKDPSRRYQSAADLADDLRALRDDHPIQARPLSVLEKTARFGRKHQSRVRVVAAAMAVTAVLIGALLYGLDRWNQSRFGAFRIRAGGGPYQAMIFPAGGSQLSENAVALTLPMQNHQKLVSGDYDMIVSPSGRWSQELRLPVTKGVPSEYRLTNEPNEFEEVSIKDASVVIVAGDQNPSIIWRHDGQLKRLSGDGDDQWGHDVSGVETRVTLVDTAESGGQESTIKVNFAMTDRSSNFDDGHHTLDDDPLFTQGAAALRTPIDLNGDHRSDFLIAATDRQALLAIDHHGKTLWSRAYEFSGLPSKTSLANPLNTNEVLRFPGVFDLQDVGDRDGDGINDVFAMLVHFRLQVKTDVCFVTISGRTGDPIHSMSQTCIAKQDTFWPVDGIFFPEQYNYRSHGGLSFSSGQVRRSGHRYLGDFHIRERARSTPLRIAVPSPPILLHRDGHLKVVCLTGDQCHLIDWGSKNSSPVTIGLPYVPAHAPKLAHSGNATRLIFHEPAQSNQKVEPFYGTNVLAYDQTGKLCWERRLANIDWQESIARNHADWPCIVDLNGDGNDEVILPRSRYRNGVEVGVHSFDAETGAPLWADDLPYSTFQSADGCLSRITCTGDIDGDGWKEIVTASISGPGSPSGSKSAIAGEAFVYVDWLSGKTGERLAWARHSIPIVGDQVRAAQIDAIRGQLPDTPRGTVEIDFVTGDRTLDVLLASAVVRFHPSRPGPVAVAAGLDVCQSPTDATSSTRVYRRRGGPFSVGGDHLILMRTGQSLTKRLGESSLSASWVGDSNRSLLATYGFQSTRMSVVDAVTCRTLWNSDRADAEGVTWIPVERIDGSIDFLVQKQRGNETPAAFINGDTGETLFQMPETVGGRIIWTRVLEDDKSVLVVGDGRLQSASNLTPQGRPSNTFRMSLVSTTTGKVRWSRSFLSGASRNNYPNGYDDLKLADVNGDGITDVVGPNSHDDELFLSAWDGSSGKKLWEQSVYQRPTRTDYWVPFSLVTISGRVHVVYLGLPSKDSTKRQLILCGTNGGVLSSQAIDQAEQIPLVDGIYSYRTFAISDATSSADRPLVAMSRLIGGRYRCSIFDLSEKTIEKVEQFQEEADHEYLAGMWFCDVDGDGVNERLVVNRVLGGGPNDGKIPNQDRSLAVKCYPMLSVTPKFEIEIPDAGQVMSVEWKSDHGVPVSWLQVDHDRFVAIDWSRQLVLTETEGYAEDISNLPVVCQPDGRATLMSFPTLDGIELERLEAGLRQAPAEDARSQQPVAEMIQTHEQFDPRRTRKLFATVVGDATLSESILGMLRGGLAFAILVVFPLWYVFRTIQNRNWSLSWMLLLPVLVGMWMVVWQSQWLDEPNVIVTLLTGVSTWMCGAALLLALRKSKDGQGHSIRLMLVVGTPFVFLAIVFFGYQQRGDVALRYTVDATDVLRIAFTSFSLVAQIYWALSLSVFAVRWLGGLWRGQTAT